jgi:hypothetical protein
MKSVMRGIARVWFGIIGEVEDIVQRIAIGRLDAALALIPLFLSDDGR